MERRMCRNRFRVIGAVVARHSKQAKNGKLISRKTVQKTNEGLRK